MIQKEIFSSSEGDQWYKRNKLHIKFHRPDVLTVEKYARLKGQGKILEIGVGGAEKLNRYSACGLESYGIDPSAYAIEEGKSLFPHLKLQVGTADQLPFEDAYFDIVIFGHCLTWVDRSLLMKVISEADRVLKDQAFIIISDFDTPYPCKRVYHHVPEEKVFSYKMSYEKLFLASPHYSLLEKVSFSHADNHFSKDSQERVATSVLFKDLEQGYQNVP